MRPGASDHRRGEPQHVRPHEDLDVRREHEHRQRQRGRDERRRQQLVPASRRLAMIQAASGRNSARSSGTAWGRSVSSSTRLETSQLGRDVAAPPPEDVGLGQQREARRGDDEADRERTGGPWMRRQRPAWCSACSGSELPAMKPATQAIACSVSTSELRRDDPRDVARARRAVQARQQEVGGVGRRARRDDEDPEEQERGHDRRAGQPAAQHGPGCGVPGRPACAGCRRCPARGPGGWGPWTSCRRTRRPP